MYTPTARNTVFPKSWNIMEISKRPSKYHLSTNFLTEKRSCFPSPKVSKQELLGNQEVSYFYQLLELKKKTVFPAKEKFKARTFQQSVNIIFSINFLTRKKTVFPITEKFKTRTFQ